MKYALESRPHRLPVKRRRSRVRVLSLPTTFHKGKFAVCNVAFSHTQANKGLRLLITFKSEALERASVPFAPQIP